MKDCNGLFEKACDHEGCRQARIATFNELLAIGKGKTDGHPCGACGSQDTEYVESGSTHPGTAAVSHLCFSCGNKRTMHGGGFGAGHTDERVPVTKASDRRCKHCGKDIGTPGVCQNYVNFGAPHETESQAALDKAPLRTDELYRTPMHDPHQEPVAPEHQSVAAEETLRQAIYGGPGQKLPKQPDATFGMRPASHGPRPEQGGKPFQQHYVGLPNLDSWDKFTQENKSDVEKDERGDRVRTLAQTQRRDNKGVDREVYSPINATVHSEGGQSRESAVGYAYRPSWNQFQQANKTLDGVIKARQGQDECAECGRLGHYDGYEWMHDNGAIDLDHDNGHRMRSMAAAATDKADYKPTPSRESFGSLPDRSSDVPDVRGTLAHQDGSRDGFVVGSVAHQDWKRYQQQNKSVDPVEDTLDKVRGAKERGYPRACPTHNERQTVNIPGQGAAYGCGCIHHDKMMPEAWRQHQAENKAAMPRPPPKPDASWPYPKHPDGGHVSVDWRTGAARVPPPGESGPMTIQPSGVDALRATPGEYDHSVRVDDARMQTSQGTRRHSEGNQMAQRLYAGSPVNPPAKRTLDTHSGTHPEYNPFQDFQQANKSSEEEVPGPVYDGAAPWAVLRSGNTYGSRGMQDARIPGEDREMQAQTAPHVARGSGLNPTPAHNPQRPTDSAFERFQQANKSLCDTCVGGMDKVAETLDRAMAPYEGPGAVGKPNHQGLSWHDPRQDFGIGGQFDEHAQRTATQDTLTEHLDAVGYNDPSYPTVRGTLAPRGNQHHQVWQDHMAGQHKPATGQIASPARGSDRDQMRYGWDKFTSENKAADPMAGMPRAYPDPDPHAMCDHHLRALNGEQVWATHIGPGTSANGNPKVFHTPGEIKRLTPEQFHEYQSENKADVDPVEEKLRRVAHLNEKPLSDFPELGLPKDSWQPGEKKESTKPAPEQATLDDKALPPGAAMRAFNMGARIGQDPVGAVANVPLAVGRMAARIAQPQTQSGRNVAGAARRMGGGQQGGAEDPGPDPVKPAAPARAQEMASVEREARRANQRADEDLAHNAKRQEWRSGGASKMCDKCGEDFGGSMGAGVTDKAWVPSMGPRGALEARNTENSDIRYGQEAQELLSQDPSVPQADGAAPPEMMPPPLPPSPFEDAWKTIEALSRFEGEPAAEHPAMLPGAQPCGDAMHPKPGEMSSCPTCRMSDPNVGTDQQVRQGEEMHEADRAAGMLKSVIDKSWRPFYGIHGGIGAEDTRTGVKVYGDAARRHLAPAPMMPSDDPDLALPQAQVPVDPKLQAIAEDELKGLDGATVLPAGL